MYMKRDSARYVYEKRPNNKNVSAAKLEHNNHHFNHMKHQSDIYSSNSYHMYTLFLLFSTHVHSQQLYVNSSKFNHGYLTNEAMRP